MHVLISLLAAVARLWLATHGMSESDSEDLLGACVGLVGDAPVSKAAAIEPSDESVGDDGSAMAGVEDNGSEAGPIDGHISLDTSVTPEEPRRFIKPNVEGPAKRAAAHAWHAVMDTPVQGRSGLEAPAVRLKGATIVVNYADDCTGIGAPLFALREVANIAKEADVILEIKYRFGSEHPRNRAAAQFVLQNHAPDVLFSDMLDRTCSGGINYGGEKKPLPKPYVVDVYTAGTDCSSISLANHSSSPIVWDFGAIADGNKSTRTMLQSLRTIAYLKVRLFILENVKTLDVESLIAFIRRELKGYVAVAVRANSLDFFTATDRDRWYVVVTRKEAVIVHPRNWPEMIERSKSTRVDHDAMDYLLAPDSSEVLAEHARLLRRGDVADDELAGDETAGGSSNAIRRRPSRKAKFRQADKFKWETEHRRVDSALRKSEALKPTPQLSATGPPTSVHDGSSKWGGLLGNRPDSLGHLCARWVDSVCSGDNQSERAEDDALYMFDIEEPANHLRMFFPNLAPVLLQKHYLALVLKRRGCLSKYLRHVLGLEHLLLMGAPRDIITHGISDCQLRSLAGNSMAVPFVTVLFTVILAAVDFTCTLSTEPCEVTDDDFVLHRSGALPGAPLAAKIKCPLPGLEAHRSVVSASHVSQWDLAPVPHKIASAVLTLEDSTAVDAGKLAFALLERLGAGHAIKPYYNMTKGDLRSVRQLRVGLQRGVGKLDVRRKCEGGVVDQLKKLCKALGKISKVTPQWGEIHLQLAECDDPIELWHETCPTLAFALPLCAEGLPLGTWWLSGSPGDALSGHAAPCELGPLLYNLMPIVVGRGKGTKILEAGKTLKGSFVAGTQCLSLQAGSVSFFSPRRKVLLCHCFNAQGEKEQRFSDLVKVGMATAEVVAPDDLAPPLKRQRSAINSKENRPNRAELPAVRPPAKASCLDACQRGLVQSQLPRLVACKSDGKEWLAPDSPLQTALVKESVAFAGGDAAQICSRVMLLDDQDSCDEDSAIAGAAALADQCANGESSDDGLAMCIGGA